MPVTLTNPEQAAQKIVAFIQETFQKTGKKNCLVAVSGGIDSAVSLSLATKALGPSQVFSVFLPFADQKMDDARQLAEFLQIPAANRREINIEPVVTALQNTTQWPESEPDSRVRLGNMMARARMILLYDLAKQLDGLVGGTENLSEKYLGYFTRFGDEASDFEPIQHLYKTQVRQLAEFLAVPEVFLTKAPSAGLWQGQTDELELGFTYDQADQVIEAVLVEKQSVEQFAQTSDFSVELIQKILDRVQAMNFKHQVPYTLD